MLPLLSVYTPKNAPISPDIKPDMAVERAKEIWVSGNGITTKFMLKLNNAPKPTPMIPAI